MKKLYTTNMVFHGVDPIRFSAPFTVFYVSVGQSNKRILANFWIEKRFGVNSINAHANTCLFLLAHEMFELLEELLPELVLAEAGETAHIDVGRVQDMLGRIEAVGPYTRMLSPLSPVSRPTDQYVVYSSIHSHPSDYIASFPMFGSPSHRISKHEQMGNALLCTYSPCMADHIRGIMSGALELNKLWTDITELRSKLLTRHD